ncbi:MAG: hypothetical protein ACK4GK_14145 [Ferrovibrio sp.]
MSDPRHTQAAGVYQYLLEKIAAGVVEVRFSVFHPLESAHIDDDAKPMALKRAEVIKALSGKKCFLWWSELINLEAICLASGEKIDANTYAFKDDGRWFPSVDGIANDVKGILEKELRRGLAKIPLPRNQKRQYRAQFIRNGRLTKAAIEVMKPGRREVMEKVRQKFPLPDWAYDEDIFFRVAAGELHAKHLVGALEEAFADLPTFIGWAYDEYDKEKELTAWLRDGTYIRLIEEIRAEIDPLVERGATLGIDASEVNRQFKSMKTRIYEVRERVLWHVYSETREARRRKGIDRKIWEARVVKSPVGSIPSFDTMMEVSADYFTTSALSAPNRRNLLVSDYGDIMHMIYMPYVDLFRCDAYASSLASSCAKKYNTKIIKKLSELPLAIDALLAAKISAAEGHSPI